jgi:hypothetical protein
MLAVEIRDTRDEDESEVAAVEVEVPFEESVDVGHF